jgi:hypothetical protein
MNILERADREIITETRDIVFLLFSLESKNIIIGQKKHSPNAWIAVLKIKKSGDFISSIKENSWGEEPISIEGIKTPVAVHKIRIERTKTNNDLFGVI